VDALDVEILAVVHDRMDARRIGEHATGLVAPHGVLVPTTLPQLVEHVEVLVGAIVALVVRQLCRQPHRARRALEVAGHDVPAHAAAGQVVERREAARQ